jgi:hypothetical protein
MEKNCREELREGIFCQREGICFFASGLDRGKNVIYVRRKEIDPAF